MCYATKRKIADCVKNLMCHKEIRKITVQDIMDETHMSRQSFYYHFKDIYDVLEWVGQHDFIEQVEWQEEQSVEDWILQIVKVIQKEHLFFEKLVREIEWPKIMNYIRKPIENQVIRLLENCGINCGRLYQEEMYFCAEFFTKSICYCLMDYVYHKKYVSNEEALGEVHFLISVLEGSELFGSMKQMGKKAIAV